MTTRRQPLADVPSVPGAYALWIELASARALPIPRLGSPRLQPGIYVYCGSARGAGGIRARVARHLRVEKKTRWHVDHLTDAGSVTALLSAPGEEECAIVSRMMAIPGANVPVCGFGSSDCARCASHLVRLPRGLDPTSVGFVLRVALRHRT